MERVGEEGYVCLSAANLLNGFGGVAQIANVGLLADFFGVQSEQPVENDGVQATQIERALALRRDASAAATGPGLARSSSAPSCITATKAVPC